MDLRWEGPGRGAAGTELQGEDRVFWARGTLPQGLWRLVALGERGELALGTAEGGALQLRRQFSRRLTDPLGTPCALAVRPLQGETPAWHSGEGTPFSLPPGARWQRMEGGWRVAYPWQVGEAFPREELFCLARVCTMAGREWVLYRLNDDGQPLETQ